MLTLANSSPSLLVGGCRLAASECRRIHCKATFPSLYCRIDFQSCFGRWAAFSLFSYFCTLRSFWRFPSVSLRPLFSHRVHSTRKHQMYYSTGFVRRRHTLPFSSNSGHLPPNATQPALYASNVDNVMRTGPNLFIKKSQIAATNFIAKHKEPC